MKSVVWLAAFVAVFSANQAFAQEPERAGQETFLTRAVFAQGELWVLSDAGRIFRISESKDTPLEEQLPEPAYDLCLFGDRPVVITCDSKSCDTWTLRRWDSGKWSIETTLQREGEGLIGLSCDANKATLLTNRRLIEFGVPEPRILKLSREMRAGPLDAVHMTTDWVFVGINAGEWGGGLQRIDRRTGRVSVVSRNSSGELCGGPLNTECDPVNGIADEPGHPGCVVAAIGLVHFSPHGRLVEVCGNQVRRFYFKPYGDPARTGGKRGKSDEPDETVAFFGLIREGETLWAAGIDGIYMAEKGKVKLAAPLPDFKKVGPFRVSFAMPRLVLVLTSVNQRHSISGNVPMLVSR